MYRIGVDIGGTNIKIGFVNADKKLFAKDIIPFEKKDFKYVCADISDKIKEMISSHGLDLGDASSLGIAVPGSVNTSSGMVLSAYNLDFFDAPIKSEMEKHFPGIKVFIANDADAAALAESKAGALIGKKTALLITLGTGTGGGLILNGKMFSGGNGRGVELGHMALIADSKAGLPCTCGNTGCIEAYCSATWLEAKGRKVFNSPDIDSKYIIDLAKAGDPKALAIFDEFTDHLSSAIASICSLLDPEAIAIGGGISECGDILYDALRAKVKEKNFFKADYCIVPAMLGNEAGIIGAAMLDMNY